MKKKIRVESTVCLFCKKVKRVVIDGYKFCEVCDTLEAWFRRNYED